MVRKIEETKYFSKRIGTLPKGCQQCVKGQKTVLFITGICPRKCLYCPISELKYQKDVIYANEKKISSPNEAIAESLMCSSEGVGITGGDPLARIDRTCEYIRKLKKKFGKEFHTHLYTSLNLVNEKTLAKLYSSGLDEIRFHPDLDDESLWNRLELVKAFDWDAGVEIPVIPGKFRNTKKLIDFIVGKVDFINLNELELSDTPGNKLVDMGFKPKNSASYGVKGSEHMAQKLLEYCVDKKIKVHYCTAKLKDRVQLKNRIKRRAKNVAQEYDIITSEGTLVRGAIYNKSMVPCENYYSKLKKLSGLKKQQIIKSLESFRSKLIRKHKIPAKLISLDKNYLRILTTGAVIEELAEEIKKNDFLPAVVEEYPTHDALIVDLVFV